LVSASRIAGQDINGSLPDSDFISLLASNSNLEEQIQVDTLSPQLNLVLTIRPFVVVEEDGQHHFEPEALDSGINLANQYFSNIGIRFKVDEIKHIPEYEYGIISDRDSTLEMEVKYAREDYINLFLVTSINLNGTDYYGYTHFPNDTLHSDIYLCKLHASGKHLTTLLGNYFGLLNTHEVAGGIEYADQSNCAEAGDYLCDTWADPGLSGMVNEECLYTGSSVDENGDYFVPSVANLMSDSRDICKCVFSIGQYRRMMFYYMNYRSNLR
jgi:hypothetical protein